jgi:L-threonylcarbamoyladenylate synthase
MGGMVACPTESFYGLAVDAFNETAIRALFRAKKRQATEPILLLIPSKEDLHGLVTHVPPTARNLIREFWPGGLTLIFEASPTVPPLLTAATGKIGIRLSSHVVAAALARAVGGPLTGTSANLSGHPPCRTAQEVLNDLGGTVHLILDGGEAGSEVGSTVLDVTVEPPRIIREGMVEKKRLEELTPIGA